MSWPVPPITRPVPPPDGSMTRKIEADPPKGTAAVNKWWDILYQMNLLDGALLNETAWSALVGMRKREARDAAKAELAAE